MWQDDIVYLQTSTEVDTYGSIAITWTKGTAVTCDVQDINKEYVYKNYGLTESTEYKQIFDHTQASWVLGEQVSYLDKQWLVRLANKNMGKIGNSNHIYVIISKVI